MTAAAACRMCGTEHLANARFCHCCGSPVVEADTHAEYKQVTVLFADVVHSMDLAAALDMERWREIVTELAERSAAVVRRYGGEDVEFTGDGVMAIFGAPTALEDHAVRALPGRPGHPGGDQPAGGGGGTPRWCGAASAGGPQFRRGDRR